MRIVIPTDFSEYAKVAIEFAIAFTKQVQAELMLLHVLPNIGPSLGTTPTAHLKKEMLQWAEKEFKLIEDEITTLAPWQ